MLRRGSRLARSFFSKKTSGLKEITQYTFGSGTTLAPNNNKVNEQITAGTQAGMNFILNQVSIGCFAANTLPFPAVSTYQLVIAGLPYGGEWFRFADNYYNYSYDGFVYVWFTLDGSGSDPGVGDYGIQVDCFSSMTTAQVANAIATELQNNYYSAFTVGGTNVEWSTLSPTNSTYDGPDTMGVLNLSSMGQTSPAIEFPDDAISIYYEIDGVSGQPHLQTDEFIISINSTDNATTVANETYGVLGAYYSYARTGVSGSTVKFGPENGNSAFDYGTGFTLGTASPIGNFIAFYEPAVSSYKYIWFNLNSACVAPYATYTIPVVIATGASANTIGAAMRTAMTGAGYTATGTNAQCFFNRLSGTFDNVAMTDQGTNFTLDYAIIAGISPYFTWQDGNAQNYNMYFPFDGQGTNPGAPGIAVACVINSSDSASTLASRVQSAFISKGFSTSRSSNVLTITNKTTGPATDATVGTITGGLSISVIQQGK